MKGPFKLIAHKLINTLEENIVSKVRSEVDNGMTTVETRI